MELDAFRSRLGVSQGRIQKDNEDGFVFVLGDIEPGYRHEMSLGDHAAVVQDVDVTDVDLVRTEVILRIPDDMPANYYWKVAVIVDGIEHGWTLCFAGRTRTITDLAANVSKMSGMHQVGVQMTLIYFIP